MDSSGPITPREQKDTLNPSIRNPLNWISKSVIALGALVTAVGAMGWQLDDWSFLWSFNVLTSLGVLLAILVMIGAVVSLFVRVPHIDMAVLFAASWCAFLTFPKFSVYDILGFSEYDYSYWPHTVLLVGIFILGLGSLLVLGSLFLSLGRQRALEGYPPNALTGVGKGVLILGAFMAFAVIIGLAVSFYGKDQTMVSVFGAVVALLVICGASVSLWRSNLLADIALVAAAGWVATFAIQGPNEISQWVDSLGNDYWQGYYWARWAGPVGVLGALTLGTGAVLLWAGLNRKLADPNPQGGHHQIAFAETQVLAQTAVPAGWFDDPGDPTRYRWWDGQQWTDHTGPR